MPAPHYTAAGRPSILIVDDYADARDVWATVLGIEGFEVQTAGTGEEALNAALAAPPSLIVLDLSLPGLSGIDVARALRARDETHDVPLVALTGCADQDELDVARAAGFDAILSKPCVPSTLLEEIHRLLPA
jgi:CheY-like chemotaxis protein